MISEFENLSLGGNNAASNHGDPFTHAELTPEQQKTLIDIRRRKTELLLEIQVFVNLDDMNFAMFCIYLGAMSDEHGERFHQDIEHMERRYNSKWSPAMLADICWEINCETSDKTYKRKRSTK